MRAATPRTSRPSGTTTGRPPITYAHIATEPGHTGLVVQYWFFYYFNQFNDVHEGDWEGMQISFDADTPAEALAEGPSQIALFQHAGGERADWDDTKVQKDGTHPIVYPAAGSHATFYDDAIYIQNGSARLGRRLRQHLGAAHAQSQPDGRSSSRPPRRRGSEFQWLSFLGHWGQREKGFNNGPTGPDHQEASGCEPFTWMDGIRQDSPRLPGGSDPWTGRLDRVLRRDRGRLGVHQPRGEDDARAQSAWRWPCCC